MLKPLESIRKKGYQHLKIATVAFENFVSNLKSFKGNMSTGESEEYHKTHLMDFFKNTYFSPNYLVAQKGDIDFVIHSSADSQSAAVVLFEVKSTTNKSEMITTDNLNKKAMQEILLYYLRERVGGNNLELKYLVVTNTEEFFIFDAHEFERLFYNNTKLRRDFQEFAEGQKSGKNTDFFYQNIAKKYIEEIKDNIEYVHFNIKDYTKLLDKDDAKSRNKLSVLYKIFSPNYLLKQSVQQDHNSLNKNFYNELLYIIGLEEVVDENKKRVIRRLEESSRNYGSIIENTITKLDADESLSKIHNLSKYGVNREEQLFNVALELSITWINRILFLKLLEAQLIRYNGGDVNQGFLNPQKVRNYDELYELFFQVLAVKYENRKITSDVPYLNSSLFEISKLEHNTIKPSNLNNDLTIKIPSSTVLKDKKGKSQYKELPTLEYLLRFLDAYDFDSESERDIQDSNRALISASVLGLIFEKINSYKDGAIFTPSFVTMYMCRESIVKVVVDKFNAHYGWNCTSINDLYNSIDHSKIIEANDIINSITICDPAVGSGHFLVSALNEIIRIKYELHILADSEGKLLKGYDFDIINDELIITDDEGNIFTYNKSKESQRIQETIFKEKQKIIENCLFGVDINPNSVNICRLRLWIELLKNTYYTKESGYQHLETLPNIDINIKCGNSLLSKYNLDVDIQSVLSIAGKDAKEYRSAVLGYKTAPSKEKKREFDQIIDSIKQTISTGLLSNQLRNSKTYKDLVAKQKKIHKYEYLYELKFSEQTPVVDTEKIAKIRSEVAELQIQFDKLRTTKTYENSFEWRFEFPEAWNDNGDFIGFDLVVGNPPYGVSITGKQRKDIEVCIGKVPDYEIYYYFIQIANKLLKNNGILSYIIPNSYLFNIYAAKYRVGLMDNWKMLEILDCSKFSLFESATVRNTINMWQKAQSEVIGYRQTRDVNSFLELIKQPKLNMSSEELLAMNQNWGLAFRLECNVLSLIKKIKDNATLESFFPDISQGLIAYDKYQGQDREIIANRAYHYTEYKDGLSKWLWGKDITRYSVRWNGEEYIDYCDGIANPRQPKYFYGKRILVREITNPSIFASIATDELYNDPSVLIILDSKNYSLEVVTGILNSKLATFFHFNHAPKATKGAFPKILIKDIKEFPIPAINSEEQSRFEKHVNQIQDQKRENPQADTSAIEAEIDQMVYTLYNLTEGEINLIESTSKQWHKAN